MSDTDGPVRRLGPPETEALADALADPAVAIDDEIARLRAAASAALTHLVGPASSWDELIMEAAIIADWDDRRAAGLLWADRVADDPAPEATRLLLWELVAELEHDSAL